MYKLIDNAKWQQAYEAKSRTTANTLFNDSASSVTGIYIDTQDYDEMVVCVNAGVTAGDGNTTFSVFAYASDAAGSAALVTGATFTAITSATDQALQLGSVQCWKYPRYMWIRAVKTGTGAAVNGVVVALHRKDSVPYNNSEVFDV